MRSQRSICKPQDLLLRILILFDVGQCNGLLGSWHVGLIQLQLADHDNGRRLNRRIQGHESPPKLWISSSGIMIMKSRMWVNWMPAKVSKSQSSRLGESERDSALGD